jgi:hypothetical protein
LNINTFDQEQAVTLHLNEIGVVEIETSSPLYFDPYQENAITGSLLLIDPATNATVAAGMILEERDDSQIEPEQLLQVPQSVAPQGNHVTATDRFVRYGHIGAIVDLQDRLEVAYRLERILFDQGAAVIVLNDASSQSVTSLVESGFLVLGSGIADFEGAIHPGSLPEDDEKAALAVYDLLVRLGVATFGKPVNQITGTE